MAFQTKEERYAFKVGIKVGYRKCLRHGAYVILAVILERSLELLALTINANQ